MKKIFLLLMAVMATMSINAQRVTVLKTTDNGTTWSEAQIYDNNASVQYKVVFGESPTTGTAKAIIDGSEVEIGWVQLWQGGPKFATRNVGATGTNDKESTLGTHVIYADAVKIGSDYVWGANWKTPSKDEMDLLNTEKVTYTYCMQDDVYGFKFTGVQKRYTENSLFLPSEGSTTTGTSYWSSTADGTGNAWELFLFCLRGIYYDNQWISDYKSTDNNYVRPILND